MVAAHAYQNALSLAHVDDVIVLIEQQVYAGRVRRSMALRNDAREQCDCLQLDRSGAAARFDAELLAAGSEDGTSLWAHQDSIASPIVSAVNGTSGRPEGR